MKLQNLVKITVIPFSFPEGENEILIVQKPFTDTTLFLVSNVRSQVVRSVQITKQDNNKLKILYNPSLATTTFAGEILRIDFNL